MISKMVDDSLLSLANQWHDLAKVFRQLTSSTKDNTKKELLEKETSPIGLIYICEHDLDNNRTFGESQRIDLERKTIPHIHPASTLFGWASQVFQTSRAVLAGIEARFDTVFPKLPGQDTDSVEVSVCREAITDLRNFIATCLQDFSEVTSDEGARFHISGIRNSVDDIASYPILTSDMGPRMPSGPVNSGPTGALPLQRTVDATIRTILGRTPRPRDPRSFLAALNQSFTIDQVEGRTEVSWTPRAFAGQTELGGGVTGAQASLYTRASEALDSFLPLLDGLYPLMPEYDPQLVDAARSIVRQELTQIVTELGVEGGPRVARVNTLFEMLMVRDILDENGNTVKNGHLGYLREVLGLVPSRVNTLEEETDVSNFLVLWDYAQSIKASWEFFRDQWYGKDLGTRLVLLSRVLSVAAEAVQEVYAAMDSVFVGDAERQVSAFRDENGQRVLVENYSPG
jgi:hypothetical protein